MIELIGLAALCWMFAESFEPIQYLKKNLYPCYDLSDPSYWSGGIMYWFVKFINCSLCSGFWFGLIYFEDIFKAAIVSIIAEGISRINKNTMSL
jgi:hypothetical protein